MDLSRPYVLQFVILTTTFMLYSFIALVIYALSARYGRKWFAGRSRALWFNRISGTIYIAFGLGLLRLKNKSFKKKGKALLMKLQLTVLGGQFTIHRLEPEADIPARGFRNTFHSH